MKWACAILSSVACPAVQHFSTLAHDSTIFRGGGGDVIGHKTCFGFVDNFCLKHFSF